MPYARFTLLSIVFLAGCGGATQPAPTPVPQRPIEAPVSFLEARRAFKTKLIRKEHGTDPAPTAPADLFRTVHYESPAGKLVAYVSPDPKDGKKHPAIIWIFGGFDNDIGDPAWEKQKPENDQSASAFRTAGLLMMYPSQRGGNDNPGFKEGLFGEVDDVIAAADFLAKQDYVDPKRIYLGGHSTGGTLALLVAAAAPDKFRAVVSFGPVDDVGGYGPDSLPFDLSNKKELELRAPIRWLSSIHCPAFVFEGTQQGNFKSLQALSSANRNELLHFYPVQGATHFSILAPVTRLCGRQAREGYRAKV